MHMKTKDIFPWSQSHRLLLFHNPGISCFVRYEFENVKSALMQLSSESALLVDFTMPNAAVSVFASKNEVESRTTLVDAKRVMCPQCANVSIRLRLGEVGNHISANIMRIFSLQQHFGSK